MNINKEDLNYLRTNAVTAMTTGLIGLIMIAEQGNITIPALIAIAGCIFTGVRDWRCVEVLKSIKKERPGWPSDRALNKNNFK